MCMVVLCSVVLLWRARVGAAQLVGPPPMPATMMRCDPVCTLHHRARSAYGIARRKRKLIPGVKAVVKPVWVGWGVRNREVTDNTRFTVLLCRVAWASDLSLCMSGINMTMTPVLHVG